MTARPLPYWSIQCSMLDHKSPARLPSQAVSQVTHPLRSWTRLRTGTWAPYLGTVGRGSFRNIKPSRPAQVSNLGFVRVLALGRDALRVQCSSLYSNSARAPELPSPHLLTLNQLRRLKDAAPNHFRYVHLTGLCPRCRASEAGVVIWQGGGAWPSVAEPVLCRKRLGCVAES